MKLYFTFKECSQPFTEHIPTRIADLIMQNHIIPQSRVRELLGAAIICSEHSCYRPKQWEFAKKRMPKEFGGSRNKWSEHTFYEESKGAFDGTAADMVRYGELLIEHTDYKRLCYYPDQNFIHCDYRIVGNNPDGKRLFVVTDSGWKQIKGIDTWISHLK